MISPISRDRPRKCAAACSRSVISAAESSFSHFSGCAAMSLPIQAAGLVIFSSGIPSAGVRSGEAIRSGEGGGECGFCDRDMRGIRIGRTNSKKVPCPARSCKYPLRITADGGSDNGRRFEAGIAAGEFGRRGRGAGRGGRRLACPEPGFSSALRLPVLLSPRLCLRFRQGSEAGLSVPPAPESQCQTPCTGFLRAYLKRLSRMLLLVFAIMGMRRMSMRISSSRSRDKTRSSRMKS